VTSATSARAFELRHLQLARAAFAALAAVMVTFSSDHSAPVGLAIFSGFAIATGLVLAIAGWLVFSAGDRWPAVLSGAISIVAGMLAGVGPWRTTLGFFVIVIAWALVSGLVETLVSWRKTTVDAAPSARRDGLVIGILTLVLGIALLFIPSQYALDYYIEDADRAFTLTGITIAVGVFGGYAAIVAVYLGIAGFSPRRETPPVLADTRADHRSEGADA
jgi:uncharacterized membrane protein HdeD (DUF308 family)